VLNESNLANQCLSVLAKVLAKEENDLQMSQKEIRECIMIASAILYSKAKNKYLRDIEEPTDLEGDLKKHKTFTKK